jgi:cytochrome c biogenesis protein CcmG/thiol:disulfide interchange protein DsbE
MKKNLLLILALVLVIGLSAFAYQSLSGRYTPQGAAGSGGEAVAAPDAALLDWDGGEVQLSDYTGKPLVLSFWASWCTYCKQNIPVLEAAAAELGEDVTVLLVNTTSNDTEATAREIAETNGYTLPVLFDTTGEAAAVYGIRSLPTTVFINADGELVSGYRGLMSDTVLREYLAAITE